MRKTLLRPYWTLKLREYHNTGTLGNICRVVRSHLLMVLGRKKDGTIRITVDFQHLNRQCFRETHHTEPPFHLASRVPPNTKKTVLDATDSYHSVN